MSTTSSNPRRRKTKKSNMKAAHKAVTNMGSTYSSFNPANRNTTSLSSTSVPRSFGIMATSNRLSTSAYRGPRVSDCATDGAVTICGSAMWSANLSTGAVSPGLYGGYGSWAFMPSEWGRLGNLADLYSYYRVRRLRISTIPLAGTAISGIWGIGINDGSIDVDASVGDSFAIGILSQYPNAVIGPVWQPLSSTFVYDGPKVYYSKADGGSTVEEWQVDMLSSSSGLSGLATYGLLYAEYEIDFLLPSSTSGTPVFSKRTETYKAVKAKRRAESELVTAQKNVNALPSTSSSASLTSTLPAVTTMNKDDFIVVHSSYLNHLSGLDLSHQKTSDVKSA